MDKIQLIRKAAIIAEDVASAVVDLEYAKKVKYLLLEGKLKKITFEFDYTPSEFPFNSLYLNKESTDRFVEGIYFLILEHSDKIKSLAQDFDDLIKNS